MAVPVNSPLSPDDSSPVPDSSTPIPVDVASTPIISPSVRVDSASAEQRALTHLAGVDGCRGGWLSIRRVITGGPVVVEVSASAAELLVLLHACAIVAIDIPIGIPDAGARACDVEARRALGRPRGSSVFPCPVRAALDAPTYQHALALSRAADGRGLSAQAFGILPKIADVDRCLVTSPEWRERLVEVHPELSFHLWNGGRSMRHAKRTLAGVAERRALVESHFGAVFDETRARIPRAVASNDDILDAFAALWTAERIHAGGALRLPAVAEHDRFGIPMRISA